MFHCRAKLGEASSGCGQKITERTRDLQGSFWQNDSIGESPARQDIHPKVSGASSFVLYFKLLAIMCSGAVRASELAQQNLVDRLSKLSQLPVSTGLL